MNTKRPVFFLILIILFLLLGLGIWKIGLAYIGIISHTNPQVDQEAVPQQAALLSLPGFDFWTCQLGVFMVQKNAMDKLASFNQSGLKAQIIGENPWIVGIGFAHTQEELKPLQEEIKAKGIDVVTKHFIVPERAFRVNGKKDDSSLIIIENVNLLLKEDKVPIDSGIMILISEINEIQDKDLKELQRQIGLLQTMTAKEQQLQELIIFAQFQANLNKLTQTR